MTSNAYPETNVQVIEKALYCLKHGETESVENWLDLLRERLTENSPPSVRVCAIADIECSRNCGTGACKREMTTENSRADALTACVHADDPKACYRVRCQLGAKCVDDDMSPRQPAAAPIDEQESHVAYVNSDGFIIEKDLLLAPGTKLYTRPGGSLRKILLELRRLVVSVSQSEMLDAIDAEIKRASITSQPAPSPADERAVHALDCQYILDDNPWAICTCGKGSPNNPRAASASQSADERAAPCGIVSHPGERVSMTITQYAELQRASAMLDWLEHQIRQRGMQGVSFDWVPSVDGEPSGYRYMRRHFIAEPKKTLRDAIDEAQRSEK